MTRPAAGPWRAALVAAGLSLAALAVTRTRTVPGLVWNDELVFAAAGRHVADGQGPLSSFYHPLAIAERGFPLPDVHMPGQAFVLGAAFRLAGATDAVAVATSRLAFVGTAAILAWAIARRWGERAGMAAAALFVLFPPDAAFAHTAMSESVFTLLTTLLLALLLDARDAPSVARAAALGLLLGAGVFHHETILVYAPAALWVVWRWPRDVRWRGLLVGGAVLAACLLAAAPFYLARAPHPHVLSEFLISDDTPAERAGTIAQNLLANLRGLPLWPREAWQWNHALQWAAVVAAIVIGLRKGGDRREVGALAALGFLGSWVVLALFYPIGEWRAVRVFMHALPPALAVIADALVTRPAGWRAHHALRLLAPAAVMAVAVSSLGAIGRERSVDDAFGRAYSAFLARSTAGHDVRLMVAAKAYRYGWDAYPVAIVVWDATDLKSVRLVEQALPVDAIVVRREERRRFLRGLEDGAYRRAFAPAPAEVFHDRYQVYLATDERP
ncbi:MAG TPA: glycosyltransferase family 39 protein [Vicinamibacteria bacterium]|nr:glycosyltransferase family 39 protein [Vicinamibacteria bacterium]